MKRKLTVTFLIIFGASLAQAHEFWLQPKKYRYKVGEEMKVDFMVGESFEGEFWDLNRHKVEKLQMHSGATVKDLSKDIKKTAGNNLSYKFDKEGTHLMVLESNSAYIEMEADKFNDYLKEDGIDNILAERTKNNQLERPSKEFYKRYAKLLVQAGAKTDETFRKRMGFRYEIIPLANPYTLKTGDYLQCRVLWEGKPAPHTMVKVWSHIGKKSFLTDIYSEDDGTIKFPISSNGSWMVSSVKMIASETEGAEYQSLWTSLVFAID
ncbi:MAG: DUF4198 domain-containing protein [Cyclobacteriaceae bacterium]|nr:DUF4198 domain-containing protein [Cyclobacteriaceae bacterium]